MKNKYLFRPDDFSNRQNVLFFEEAIQWLDCEKDLVLDLGCGTGNSYNYFKNWFGVTGNKQEIKCAPAHIQILMYHLDMHDLFQLPDNRFDAFIMWDSLEHCVSPFIALDEAKSKLKEGGKGIIFMPGQNWLNHHDHIHVMTVPQMKQLLKQIGLELIRVNEKNYENKNIYCEGMAIYYIKKNRNYKAVYKL